jgi:DNA helicase II / ATP-dependent DNA helicase PcrA
MNLNPQQKEAVEHMEGPLLVLAGAGSGKTRVVTHRIIRLLELGVPASEILAVTFTNKAAAEMRERIRNLSHATILASTFHSLCARILRESIPALGYTRDFTIYDEDDSEKLIKECVSSLGRKEEKAVLKALRAAISQAKNNLVNPSDDFEREVFHLYQQRLKMYNALDFDDLLALTVRLFKEFPEILKTYQHKWSFILIDEYQDTNAAQYALIKFLSSLHHNIFAVGDPDQSIYSWRGADIHNILNFEHDFPGAKVVALEENYRSNNTILKAANALISHNRGRKEKNLWSQRGEGEKVGLYICDNERMEADFVIDKIEAHHRQGKPLNECAIFYRTNFQSRVFEDALLSARIPYVIVGGLSFYQRREIKDILSYLRMVAGGSDFLSFARTINLPKRGIGEATLEKIKALSHERGCDILTLCNALLSPGETFKLSPKQQSGLQEYLSLIDSLKEMAAQSLPLHEILSQAIERSRYLQYLREDPESYEERRGNLDELISKAMEWEGGSLSLFLEELSLKSSADESTLAQDAVKLMTFHSGKGLEFTTVFLVGMEEDLFPHANARDSEAALEEERRLCYVGMTRAKENLYLSASRYRFLWGSPRMMRPSRFLKEIPSVHLRSYHHREEDCEEEEYSFHPGDTVIHKDFGAGVVRKTYQTSLGTTYDVFFPLANTTRTLIAKYAKLSPSDQ